MNDDLLAGDGELERGPSGTLGQAVLDALPSQVAVLDAAGKIVAVNLAWRLFAAENGGSAALEQGLGLSYLGICRAAEGSDAIEAQWIADGIESVLQGRRERFAYDYPCHSPDCERWFTVTATPLHRPLEGAILIHTDITARKRAERESQAAREAAAQAARLNDIGILAHSVVHELAQPLSAAGFYSATAVSLMASGERVEPKDLAKVLDGVDTQIKRAADIVQRLREFVRRRKIRMERVELGEIVVRALAILRWFAGDKDVEIILARPLPHVTVKADSIQLEQVLVHLVSNSIQAIDAAHARRREVVVSLVLEGDMVDISVRDTGPGLAPDTPSELFDLFAPPTGQGLGMGLAISREIVEAHGGKLWADRAPSQGAVLHFTLPLSETSSFQ